jgi:PAS domain S-box-containing protein
MDDKLALAILDQSPDAVIFATPDGNISYWNEAAARVFGHSVESALGQNLDIIIPEQYREAHWNGFEKAIETGETNYKGQALATRSMRPDGEKIYVELSFAVVKDASGKVAGALAFGRDITERFTSDRELRRKLRELEKASVTTE